MWNILTGPRVKGVALKTQPERDLDGYIFNDVAHAREWLTQEFVTDAEYSACIVSYRRTRCCNAKVAVKIEKLLTRTEFLALKPEELEVHGIQ